MSRQSENIEKLVESVADGDAIDWDALEQAALDDSSRRVLRQLRLIASVADVHRSTPDESDDVPTVADGAVTVGVDSGGEAPAPGAVAGARAWGHLLLLRKIGEGAFGEVYQAHDTWLDHPVALKLLKRDTEGRLSSTILQEARTLARVRHANVVTIHGADRHDGRVGFWMDFVEGETLEQIVRRGRLSAGEAAHVGVEVCRALAAVHQARLIHRDVKAQNVMRASDGGRIILMDFGAGEVVDAPRLGRRLQGTPLYLAPEVLYGGPATVRSDIYSVGVLLYHLVTGRFPIEGASLTDVMAAHARHERRRLLDERPDLPESFVAIVERATDADPERRYASAGEMEARLSGEPTSRLRITAGGRRARESAAPAARMTERVAGFAAALLALTGVLGFIATRAFDVILHIDRDFSTGLFETVVVGAQSLFPILVFWLFGIAVAAAMASLRPLLPSIVREPFARVAAWLESKDQATLAAAVFLVAASAWFIVNEVVFGSTFEPIYALLADPATASSLDALGSAGRGGYRAHLLLSVYASLVVGLIVWRWFPALERRAGDAAAVRFWKWATVAAAFLFVAWTAVPRRVVWERFPVAVFDQRTGFVIGSTGSDALVYLPGQPGRPQIRVRQDDARLQRTGVTGYLFDPTVAR